ncbi:MAG: hypothetical protein HYZ24_07630, partial [Chloroflexi bacterium]|nr:hypothetical protein [Chloroflexota bacterium]
MKRILISLLVILLTLASTTNASAQAPYYFEVEKLVVHVFWNSDGTVSIDYTWHFNNLPGSHPIDFVDVGMPNYNFDTSTLIAEVNGTRVAADSGEYQGSGSGFAVVLGSQAIQPGQSGVVHVFVPNLSSVLYNDSSDANYASATFAPTWFGSQYVSGATDFTMTFHLPPNMTPEEPRWHEAPGGFPSEPQAAYDDQNRVTYTWYAPTGNVTGYYVFGASFPKSYVPAESIYTPPPEPLISGDTIFILLCGGFFVFIFIVIPALSAAAGRRRKMQYLPPRVAIEGHGIKRGLTAVEAAILLEQPLDKVMTMILFGAVKKNAAAVKTRNPLELEIAKSLPENLQPYEAGFLKAFKIPDKKARQTELQDMTVALVKTVSEKLRGFSRKETIDYYKAIMEKAWAQVEQADTPEVKAQKMEESLEWTMLDKDYDDRARRVYRGPVYVPMWWGRYDPTYTPRPTQTGGGFSTSVPSQPSGRSALPGADFAASVVTGVQTFSQNVVGNIQTFTEKVTGATNPPPKPSSSGGRSGGGGGRSCACACACAGCACACAGG